MTETVTQEIILHLSSSEVNDDEFTHFHTKRARNKTLAQLDNLRQQNVMCDVILQSKDGKQFNAHSVILAASSTTFAHFLTTTTILQPGSVLALNGLSSVELECLLNYIYCTSPKNEEEAVMIVPLLKPFGIVSWLDDIVKKKERSSDDSSSVQSKVKSLVKVEPADEKPTLISSSDEDESNFSQETMDADPRASFTENLNFLHAATQPNLRGGSFRCKYCTKSYTKYSLLQKHISNHETASPMFCKKCNQGFPVQVDFDAHMETHGYICSQCDLEFSVRSKLLSHVNSAHLNTTFPCKTCSKEFSKQSKLDIHMLTHSDAPKPWVCKVCDKSYTTKGILTTHMISHNEEKPFKCNSCDRQFIKLANLRDHHRRRHQTGNRKYHCSSCPKMFFTMAECLNHERIHNNFRPFVCKICQKGFTTSAQLKMHGDVHIEDRKFACNQCSKTFKSDKMLKYHKKNHSLIQPYICSICNKGFPTPTQLRYHVNGHSDRREFACPTCKKTFRNMQQLKRHQQIHNPSSEEQIVYDATIFEIEHQDIADANMICEQTVVQTTTIDTDQVIDTVT